MSSIYEKCIAIRNENKVGTKKYQYENQILLKLMEIAFQNDSNFDHLPKVFYLYHVKLPADKLYLLFKKLGIDIDIRLIDKTNFSGFIFEITITS